MKTRKIPIENPTLIPINQFNETKFRCNIPSMSECRKLNPHLIVPIFPLTCLCDAFETARGRVGSRHDSRTRLRRRTIASHANASTRSSWRYLYEPETVTEEDDSDDEVASIGIERHCALDPAKPSSWLPVMIATLRKRNWLWRIPLFFSFAKRIPGIKWEFISKWRYEQKIRKKSFEKARRRKKSAQSNSLNTNIGSATKSSCWRT